MSTLRKDVHHGYCAIYTHREDIRDVVRYIKQKKGKVIVDKKSFIKVGNKASRNGFFMVLKGRFIKFLPLISPSENIPCYVWMSRGGDSLGI